MAGEMHCNGKHHGKKSVINMMWLLISVLRWPIIIMIGPGGLLF
jgi:hypothetical protein